MHANALEVALALWRMPSMRTTLRRHRLPDGIGQLIELAAGASGRIAQAAARADVTPGQLLEAVRFYASEILMHEGADAYRVLGVDPGAAPGQIKAHHRALQQWLHPDRRGDALASVYASRVNVAWGELRTPERRTAYDARLAQSRLAATAGADPRRVLVADWRAAPADHAPWRRWAALATLVAVCAVLIVLIKQQASVPPPEWVVASGDAPVDSPEPLQLELAALAERVAARLPGALRVVAARPPDIPALTTQPPAISPAPAPVAPLALHGKPADAAAARVIVDHPPAPVSPAIVLTPAEDRVRNPVAPAVAAPRIAAGKPPVGGIATATAEGARVPPPRTETQPDGISGSTQVDALERVRLAHLRGREVTRYLAGPSSAMPPIWRSIAAQDAASAVRQRLDGGRTGIGRMLNSVRFGEPDWRIGADHATMTAAIQRSRGGTDDAPATLQVKLAWREGMWLVDSIETENLP